jgi:hypothetical protein
MPSECENVSFIYVFITFIPNRFAVLYISSMTKTLQLMKDFLIFLRYVINIKYNVINTANDNMKVKQLLSV